MEAIKTQPHYRSELTGKNRGRGVAIGFWQRRLRRSTASTPA